MERTNSREGISSNAGYKFKRGAYPLDYRIHVGNNHYFADCNRLDDSA